MVRVKAAGDLVRDQRIERLVPLIAPDALFDELPLTDEHMRVVLRARSHVHAVLSGNGNRTSAELEGAAFRMRRRLTTTAPSTYVASCSFRTVLYKGLVRADALPAFYLDFEDPRFEVPFAVFHQRFELNVRSGRRIDVAASDENF